MALDTKNGTTKLNKNKTSSRAGLVFPQASLKGKIPLDVGSPHGGGRNGREPSWRVVEF
jgi:hypothetical protein